MDIKQILDENLHLLFKYTSKTKNAIKNNNISDILIKLENNNITMSQIFSNLVIYLQNNTFNFNIFDFFIHTKNN